MKITILLYNTLFICWFFLGGCSDKTNTSSIDLSNSQRAITDQIISIFENNTPMIQYDYIENLDDGRGYTAGRAGFTSATGDMLEVVERYTEISWRNALAVYLPRLRELSQIESASVEGLEGLEQAWEISAKDIVFQKVQDDVVDDYYFYPALDYVHSIGLTWPLSILCIYDTIIQHGEGDDLDGLPEIIRLTTLQAEGTPLQGIDEGIWLQTFLEIRRNILLNPTNQDTKAAWIESIGRVDTLTALYEEGNVQLTPPIVINPWGDTFTINK